jgi:hypothetical protein
MEEIEIPTYPFGMSAVPCCQISQAKNIISRRAQSSCSEGIDRKSGERIRTQYRHLIASPYAGEGIAKELR